MRLNGHDDAGWRAIARSCGVPDDIASQLWLRVEEDAKDDPRKAELAFRRLLDEVIAVNALTSALDVSENNPATPGKATRVIDVDVGSAPANVAAASDADSSPVARLKHALIDAVSQGERAVGSMTGANAKTIAEALRRLGQGNGKALWSVDDGSLSQVLRLADALVTIVEQGRAQKAGEQLPGALRGELESKLNVDFGDLRVHTDSAAAEAARGHNAIAFAKGKDVFFADGAYDPASTSGRALIAHEATHVAQQRDGGSGSGVSAPGSAVEVEADRVASAFAAGMSPGAREFAVTQRAGAGTISRKDPDPAAANLAIKSTTTAKAASGGNERYTVGVGEEVKFEEVGGQSGDWTASGGTPATSTGPSLLWNAPGTAGQFQIQLKSGSNVATKSVAVILPTGVKFTRHDTFGPPDEHMMGAGMELDMQLEPLTVSFTKATIREQPGGAHGMTGYFATVASDLAHHPATEKDGTPSKTQIRDDNKTGSYDYAKLQDDKEDPWPKPIQPGSMSWDIPYLYSAGDVTDASFAIVNQTMGVVDSKGTVTVTKGAASTTRTPKAPLWQGPPKGGSGSTSGKHVEKLSGRHDARLSGEIGGSAPAADGSAGTPKDWKVDIAGQVLNLSDRLSGAHDNGDGTKTIPLGQTFGPLKLVSAKFKQNAAGDKVESGTLTASIESGVLSGTIGTLTVNSAGKASGKLIIPIKAPKLFAKEVSVEIGDGKIIGKVILAPGDFAASAADFPIKESHFELTVTGSATGVEVTLTGTAQVTVENGMASGAATMDIALKVDNSGVTFTATVKGKISIQGIAEADAVITYDGTTLKMDSASSSIPIKVPGIEGTALVEYKGGKLSLDSTDLHFTLPQLAPVKFESVHAEKSKLAAKLTLGSPIKVPLPGGASLSLDSSTIEIDGSLVKGDITGTFNLGNAGGFSATATLHYEKGGGFGGSVTINGGAEVKVAGVEVTINGGSKLTIAKNAEGLAVEGDIGGKVKLPGVDAAQIETHVIAKKGEPIDLTVDAHLPLVSINKQLGGDVHVTYKRGGGANAFSFEASNVSVNAGPVKGQILFSSLKAHLAGKEITGSLTANPGTVIKVGSTSVTIVSGEIQLLPGRILNGHLTAKSDNGGTGVEATVGWNNGKFDWAAEGNFDLDQLTNHKLKGSVHAAAGSNGTGNFESNGPVTFGDPALAGVQISHLAGNKEEGRYTATVSATQLFSKLVDKIPSVQVTPVTADFTVTVVGGKFSFDAAVSAGVRYPKTGPSQLEGNFHVAANATGFAAAITDVKITAGEYFKTEGGSIDPQTGEVNIGKAEFDIKGIAHGLVTGHANVKTGEFHLETEATATVAALKGATIKVVAEKEQLTATLVEGTPPIKFGKFASVTLDKESSFDLKKGQGLTGHLVGTVEAKGFGNGTFTFDYADKELKGTATVHAEPFAMFDRTDFALSLQHGKLSTTNEAGIVLKLAPAYTNTFAAQATVKIHDNTVEVTGQVTELKNLGKISDAFQKGGGAQIRYANSQVTMKTVLDVGGTVIPELATGSTLTFEYKDKVVSLEGILKPKSYGPVAFSDDSHLTAKWDSGSKHFSVDGAAHADIANLCTVDFTVEAGAGGGQPGAFGLKGNINADKLAAKIPGVTFSTITADFHVLIGQGKQADLNFKVHAGIAGIPAAGITEIQASVDAEYQSGQGLSGTLAVQRAKLGEVIADGSISVAHNKFSQGTLHLVADFPSLKIEGTGTITPGEMGGLDTTADLKVTPGAESALAKFIQSGNIHVDIKKWKLTNAVGQLHLVPPSFLPLVDPTIEVGYTPDEGIHACLKTEFAAPMAKNGEMGHFEAGYKKGTGLYAHIDFPLTLPGFQQATIAGDLNSESIKLSATLVPKDPGLIKQAKIEAGYAKSGGFYLQGTLTLHASDELELEVGLRYDGNGLSIIGITPQDKNANNEDHEIAGFKQHVNIPLLTVGVASLNLQFGMGVAAGYRMPKIKFKNPEIEGGLDALDKGGMPAVKFGGSIAMGAYVALTLSVQIVGEIQLLIASCDAGIGAEICARLNLELGADVDGRFAPGQGALLKIDPFVGASLDLIASLIATLHAEICWFTIVDKKWTLASANLAHIELGSFRPFNPVGLQIGGPGGTHLTDGLALREDAFSQISEGVKKGGQDTANDEANKDARDKVKPVLDAFKAASHQFENLPEGWQNGMTVAPVNFNSMFPGVDNKAWDYYQDNADNAENVYPQGACRTPVEKLSKAVAIMARRNPVAAGMLILGWRRAQIAHMGINPDTGVNVVLEREEVQALIQAKYEADLAAAQQKQKEQDEEHARHVLLQTTQFAKAEVDHTNLGQQQKADHHAKTARTEKVWKEADQKLNEASQKAAKEGAKEKPSASAKQPPPPPAADVPVPKPLAKPAPIPVPPPVPLPPPAQVLPPVTLPALPTNPGVDMKAAAPIVPSKGKPEVQSPGVKEAPKGGSPDPTPGATTSNAKQEGGGGGSPMPGGGGGGGGGGKAGGGGVGGSSAVSPVVAAGPAGIVSQGSALDAKKAELGGKPSPSKGGGKPPAAPPVAAKPAAPAPGGAPATGAKTPAGAPPAGDKSAPGAKPGGGGPLDPTVQKVVDAGKADENSQKQTLSQQDKDFQAKVTAKSDTAKTEAKKLDVAAEEAKKKKEEDAKKAAAAAAAAKTPGGGPAKPGDKPKGPIGQKVVLDILGEIHTQYMETTGAPMVASSPTPVSAKLDEIDGTISKAPRDIKNVAAPKLATARGQATQLASLGAKAAAGDETALTAVTPAQQTLAPALKASWSWAKVAGDPAVTSGSIEDPLLHPYYTTFKARVATLSSAGHINVDVNQFAEATWTKICKAVKAANPAMTDPKAYSDFEQGWLDMKSPKFLEAISEFDHLGKEIAKAASTSLAKAQHFGFWSKDEGRALAEQISDVTLETSAVGGLMDGLPTLDGKKAGWDPEIWGALSHAYATAIIPEVIKGKKINVCIGAGVPPGNIWEAVESVALTKGLEKVGMSLEAVSTYYGAAAKTKANRKELDHTKQANGIKGCLFVGPRSGAIAAANAHFAKLTDAPVVAPPAAVTPPPPAAAVKPGQPAAPAPAAAKPPTTVPAPVSPAPLPPAAANAAPAPAGTAPTAAKPGAAPAPATPPAAPPPPPVPTSLVVKPITAKANNEALERALLGLKGTQEFGPGGDAAAVTKTLLSAHPGAKMAENGQLTLPAAQPATLGSATTLAGLASEITNQLGVSKVKMTNVDGKSVEITVGINPEIKLGKLEPQGKPVGKAELKQMAAAARAVINQNDAALKAQMMNSPTKIKRVIVGAGFASVATYVTLPESERQQAIGIGFADPWALRSDLLMGQTGEYLQVAGFPSMTDFNVINAGGYLPSSVFADVTALARAEAGMAVFPGWAGHSENFDPAHHSPGTKAVDLQLQQAQKKASDEDVKRQMAADAVKSAQEEKEKRIKPIATADEHMNQKAKAKGDTLIVGAGAAASWNVEKTGGAFFWLARPAAAIAGYTPAQPRGEILLRESYLAATGGGTRNDGVLANRGRMFVGEAGAVDVIKPGKDPAAKAPFGAPGSNPVTPQRTAEQKKEPWDAPADFKLRVPINTGGATIMVYTQNLDLASGPGPARKLHTVPEHNPDNKQVGDQVDPTRPDKYQVSAESGAKGEQLALPEDIEVQVSTNDTAGERGTGLQMLGSKKVGQVVLSIGQDSFAHGGINDLIIRNKIQTTIIWDRAMANPAVEWQGDPTANKPPASPLGVECKAQSIRVLGAAATEGPGLTPEDAVLYKKAQNAHLGRIGDPGGRAEGGVSRLGGTFQAANAQLDGKPPVGLPNAGQNTASIPTAKTADGKTNEKGTDRKESSTDPNFVPPLRQTTEQKNEGFDKRMEGYKTDDATKNDVTNKTPPPPPPSSGSGGGGPTPPPPPPPTGGATAVAPPTAAPVAAAPANQPPRPGANPASPVPATPAAVSRHAAGAPPAGWQSNVARAVPSTDVAPDDPGHTYHLLNNGDAVTTTEPQKLAAPQAAALRAKVGLPGLPKTKDEQDVEKFVTDEIASMQNKSFRSATEKTAFGLVNSLEAFVLGLELHGAKKFPKNEKVIEGTKFITDKRTAIEGACHREFVANVLSLTNSPKADPATYRAIEALKPDVKEWQRAFTKEAALYPDGVSSCSHALKEIDKAQQQIIADRDTALKTAKQVIDGLPIDHPVDAQIKVEIAKVQIWFDALDVPDPGKLAINVQVARTLKEKAVADAAKTKATTPSATPSPTTTTTTSPAPTTPAAPEAAQAKQPGKPAAPAPDPALEEAKRKKEEKDTQLKLLAAKLDLMFEKSMQPYEGFNTVASIALGAASWVALFNPAVGLTIAGVKTIGGFTYKYLKQRDLMKSKERLLQLDDAGLLAMEQFFEIEGLGFADAVRYVKVEAARLAAGDGALKATAKKEGAALVSDTAEMGANAAALAGSHAHELLHVVEHATALLGPAIALKDLVFNFREAHHLHKEIDKLKEELDALRAAAPAASSSPGPNGPPPPPSGGSAALPPKKASPPVPAPEKPPAPPTLVSAPGNPGPLKTATTPVATAPVDPKQAAANPASTPTPAPETKQVSPTSKHAAGPPPPNWRGQVVTTVPSEKVVPDDPGHTYHVLKSGKAVSTSNETELDPKTTKEAFDKTGITPSSKQPEPGVMNAQAVATASPGIVVGHPLDNAPDGQAVLSALSQGNPDGLSRVGVGTLPIVANSIEWGLDEWKPEVAPTAPSTNVFRIIRGDTGGVPVKDNYKRLGHSHPARELDPLAFDSFKRQKGSGSMTLNDLLANGPNRARILPSASDFYWTFQQNVDRHTVHTPYQIDPQTQEVFNPTQMRTVMVQQGKPLAFVIDKSLFKLDGAMYKGVIVATAGGAEVWRGDFQAMAQDSGMAPDVKQKTDVRKVQAAGELAKIPVAMLSKSSPSPGHGGEHKPLDRDTYYLSAVDATKMISLLEAFSPDVQVRDYKKGFVVRRDSAEWYFERREGLTQMQDTALAPRSGAKKDQQPSLETSLPTPNASTAEIHGFRGVRTVDSQLVKAPKDRPLKPDETVLAKEKADRVNAITASVPLLWAGHIGVSLDGGKQIWGFTPDRPLDVSKEAFMSGLRQNKSFPGLVKDDKYVFELANHYAQAEQWNTEVYVATQLLDPAQKKQVSDQITSMTQNDGKGEGQGHGKKYQFPYADKRNDSNFEDTNTANCAIFPTMVDVPVPEPTGILDNYMPKLQDWASEGPLDMKKVGKVGT